MRKHPLRALFLAVVLCSAWGSAQARDAFVLISGGGTQLSNNYSQYLQARAVEAWFHANYPRDSTWVFFGAGNREDEAPVFGDVRRQVKVDGLVVDSWVPGTLRDNLPAKREVILRTFREEILPAVREGGTLYLFVGDHGHLTRGGNPESAISLWTLEPSRESRRGWRSNRAEELAVSTLRDTMSAGIGKGRVVFVMTQCHSGGFHHLSVPRKMQANPAWFTTKFAPVAQAAAPALLAAGFTATDEQSLAAGCDPSPDPETWAGYERYLPEQLLGLDLFSLGQGGRALPSFAEAHIEATLVDQTIDKPMSTAEQYLERWADLIETDLAASKTLTPQLREQVEAYRRNVDTAKPDHPPGQRLFVERQGLFERFISRMAEQNPAVKPLLLTGTRSELEQAAGPRQRTGGDSVPPRRRGGPGRELQRLWTDTLRPVWRSAVMTGQFSMVPPQALEFERHLLELEDNGRDFLLRDREALPAEVFWEAGYDAPATVDADKAAAIAQWAAQRRYVIQDWAQRSFDPAIKAAGDQLAQSAPPRMTGQMPARTLSRRTAAQRVLFYRRVMAAWAFLIAVREEPALQRLQQLIELERSPLPAKTRSVDTKNALSKRPGLLLTDDEISPGAPDPDLPAFLQVQEQRFRVERIEGA